MSHAESRRELHDRHVSVRGRARPKHLRRRDPVTDDTSAVAAGRPPPLRSVASATSVRAAFIDHVTILVRDYEASRAFYRGALAPWGSRKLDFGDATRV